MAINRQIKFSRDERPEEPTIIAMGGEELRVLSAETATYYTAPITPNPGNMQISILFSVGAAAVPVTAHVYVDWLDLSGTVIIPLQLDACTPADFATYTSGDTSVVPILIQTPPPRYRVRVEFQATGTNATNVNPHLAIGISGSVGTARG